MTSPVQEHVWFKPNRAYGGRGLKTFSSVTHKSCWDCSHIRVAGFPARGCILDTMKHIYRPMPADQEAIQEEFEGRAGTVADRCLHFRVDKELLK